MKFLFRSFINLFVYLSLIKKHYKGLNERFRLRKDWIGRLYTVINLNDYSTIYPDENENMKRIDLNKFVNDLDNELININVKELVEVDRLVKLDEQNYLIVITYKYMSLKGLTRFIIFLLLSALGFLIYWLTTF